jgi:hypothetical protein
MFISFTIEANILFGKRLKCLALTSLQDRHMEWPAGLYKYSQLRSSDKVTHEELHLAFACRRTTQLQCQHHLT